VDRIIIAASDVVEAWDNHTLELDAAIRTLAEALQAARAAQARQQLAQPGRVAVTAGVGPAR
jgi:exonuclease VII small subunit